MVRNQRGSSPLDIPSYGETKQILLNYHGVWAVEDQQIFPMAIRKAVYIITMIRSLVPESPIYWLPNELLFAIFRFFSP